MLLNFTNVNKFGIIFIISFLHLCSNVTIAQKALIDDVVAIVGDDAILRSDIEYQYEQALLDGTDFGGDIKGHIFEQLLIQKLMVNQANIDSIMVGENEVVNQVDIRINNMIQQIGGEAKLEEYLNKPLSQFKREQMELMRNLMISQSMQREITKNVKVTPSEIRSYFNRISQDSIPFISAQYELQQIVLYPSVEQKEIDRIKNKLRDFQKQVSEGRDFATLAVLNSEDVVSASRGGELGWTAKAGFATEFSAVAFNLQEKGKVSKIVETEYGFHIIQLIDRKGDRINVRHILMKPKISSDSRKKAIEFLDTLSVSINSGRITFEDAAMRYSMDKDSRSNGGVMINRDGSTKYQSSDIPSEIAKAIQGLEEGQISKPFKMLDDVRGKETYRIVMLKKRYSPHRANMKDDYSLLQDMVEEMKRKEAIDSWIRKRQSEIYVKISPEWQNCDFQYKGWVK